MEKKKVKMSNKKAILIVAYGTSYKEELYNNILNIEERIKNKFRDYYIKLAFTSNIVINKLYVKHNIKIDSLEYGIENLKNKEFKEVYILPLHLIEGVEYEKILEIYDLYKDNFEKLIIGKPLLYEDKNYELLLESIKYEYAENEGIVFMGHGSKENNNSYLKLQSLINKNNYNIYVGTLEGYKGINDIVKELKKDNITNVILSPLTLVFGYHAKKHMIKNNDSWENILKKNGFKVKIYSFGLGSSVKIQDIYINNLKKMVSRDK